MNGRVTGPREQTLAGYETLPEPRRDAPAPASAGPPGGGHGTVEFMLRRMRHRSDLPALSDAVRRIHRIADSESERLNQLCDEVLRDVALTNKLLRLVNSAHYASAGHIGTVSRAVQLVGFAGIRNLALSLVLLEHIHDRAQAAVLEHEFLRAVMCGTLAAELADAAAEREQGFLGAMFQGLGRLLVEYYLPEEGREIRRRLPAPEDADAATIAARRAAASAEVLGIGFEDLGIGVARSWGLPETLVRRMRPLDPQRAAGAAGGEARLRQLATAANVLVDLLLDSPSSGAADARLQLAAARQAAASGGSAEAVVQAVARARQRMQEVVAGLGLATDSKAPVRRLIAAPPGEASAPERHDEPPSPLPAVVGAPGAEVAAAAAGAADRLAAGLLDVTEAMAEGDAGLQQLLRMVLETVYRGLEAQRVVFCVRDSRTRALVGRFGLGHEAVRLCPQFRIGGDARDGAADLLAAACARGTDLHIADADAATVAGRLPAWFRSRVAAPSFLLLPLRLKDQTVALIYVDRAQPGGFDLDERVLTLLRTLRNQALMALRQGGG